MIVAQDKTGYYGLSIEAPRPKKNHRKKSLPGGSRLALTGVVLVCFLVGIVITYYYSQVLAMGYQISRLEKELSLLRVENNNLDEEVHRLASLDRVQSLAINKLGMVKPNSNNILVVAVAGKAPQTPDAGVKPGQAAVIYPADEEKSRLIRAFTELVNRLENKSWLGRGLGAGSEEGANANNQYFDPEKNNRTLSFSGAGALRIDFSSGLAAAC